MTNLQNIRSFTTSNSVAASVIVYSGSRPIFSDLSQYANFLSDKWLSKLEMACSLAGDFSTRLVVCYIAIDYTDLRVTNYRVIRSLDTAMDWDKNPVPAWHLPCDSIEYRFLYTMILDLLINHSKATTATTGPNMNTPRIFLTVLPSTAPLSEIQAFNPFARSATLLITCHN